MKDPKVDVASDAGGKTAIIWAIASNYEDVGAQVLSHSKIDINKPDGNGKTPLMYAAESPDIRHLDALLKKGAKLNLQDNDGKTALMYAVIKAYVDQVKKLLEAGADKTLKDNDGGTALDSLRSLSPNLLTSSQKAIIDMLEGSPVKRLIEKFEKQGRAGR